MNRVPKTFNLVGKTWQIKVVTTKQLAKASGYTKKQAGQCKGVCSKDDATIFLNSDVITNKADFVHTYCHELMHALQFAGGSMDHCEIWTECMGGQLNQVAMTSKGKQEWE